jgi:UDP-N-acetylglucosamine 2-epimerase (non-hydrolysing)
MKRNFKTCFIIGTRPEIIKMSSLIREYVNKKKDFFILHTNQHYSDNLDSIFFKELKLPLPKYNLNVGSGSHGEQTSKMLILIEKVLQKESPELVFVEGDTNTVLAGALAASKLHIKIAHIESGLRSYSKEMPEEKNRIIADHISDFLFPPTIKAKEILLKEGINNKTMLVSGNTIVDAVYENLRIAEKSEILFHFNIVKESYLLLTLHREENVDNKKALSNVLEAMGEVSRLTNMPIIFPIHPRTKKRIKEFNLLIPQGLIVKEPVGYMDFLILEKNAKVIYTDSGGVQEEACILGVPCITLRDNTERPETLDVGANTLVGTNVKKIVDSSKMILKNKITWSNPFGDGMAYKMINYFIEKEMNKSI